VAPASTNASQTNSQPVQASTDMDLLTREPSRPPADGLRRGGYAAAVDFARPPIESVEGDLRSMHVEPGYDRHWGLLYSSDRCQLARVSRAERGRPRLMPSLRGEPLVDALVGALQATVDCARRHVERLGELAGREADDVAHD